MVKRNSITGGGGHFTVLNSTIPIRLDLPEEVTIAPRLEGGEGVNHVVSRGRVFQAERKIRVKVLR